ncbi:MAG: hypothetical protein JF616_09940 [Fibrobacteres bacterium]|nr:hypothetical protein [Fibrobacterota bacterium]
MKAVDPDRCVNLAARLWRGLPGGSGKSDRSIGKKILDYRASANHLPVIFLPFVEKIAAYGP